MKFPGCSKLYNQNHWWFFAGLKKKIFYWYSGASFCFRFFLQGYKKKINKEQTSMARVIVQHLSTTEGCYVMETYAGPRWFVRCIPECLGHEPITTQLFTSLNTVVMIKPPPEDSILGLHPHIHQLFFLQCKYDQTTPRRQYPRFASTYSTTLLLTVQVWSNHPQKTAP